VAEAAATAARGWHTPPGPHDARVALEAARTRETSWLRLFSADWKRARALVAAGYTVPGESRAELGRRPGAEAHDVTSLPTGGASNDRGHAGSAGRRPAGDQVARSAAAPVTHALTLLIAGQDADAALRRRESEIEQSWGHPPRELGELVEKARRESDPAVVRWRELLSSADPAETVAVAEQLDDAGDILDEVLTALDGFLVDADRLRLDVAPAAEPDSSRSGRLTDVLRGLAAPATAAAVPALAGPLLALHEHPEVLQALRRLSATVEQLEYAVSAAALEQACAADIEFARFDGGRLAKLVSRVQRVLPELFAAQARLLVAQVRSAFLAQALHAQRSVAGMPAPERERRQAWNAGRRVLEHEFGKVQRYRSIRELSSGDSGTVVAALRPVWLMSPESVSDTLPLRENLFDVVIYDEASQIPVEEAVPAMYRAGQVIVVGDRMQLPPTQYFAVRDTDAGHDGDDEIAILPDGDSLLSQAALRLPSTMLTWHYRSRYEALIAFSNAMFYGGRLAVVPDRSVPSPGRRDVVVDVTGASAGPARDDVSAGVDALLERSISLHRTTHATYRRRVNAGEAAYVAELVRELLRRGTGLTLGIVAFSQPQQAEIERALEALALRDDLFARRYEAELSRRDEEQSVGLFVKNLENVQGDERDVIIMSVCYAPGPNGRMLMNFGPINARGGAKRLNVIVSRARRHLAVVSSIEPTAITNTYNDGAGTLRRFLTYAQAVSRGETTLARQLLGAGPATSRGTGVPSTGPEDAESSRTAEHLARELRARGLVVAEGVGQSAFRCDLALRRPRTADFQVAVLIDTPARTESQPLTERLTSHPAVLAAAGWTPVHVLTRDWLDDPEMVLQRLLEATT
jgi:hypothetical protein